MRIYISGDLAYSSDEKQSNFVSAKQFLISSGLSPEQILSFQDFHWLILPDFATQIQFRLKLLSDCDSIYMLRNWKDSIESRHELTKAMATGLEVFYEGDAMPQTFLHPKPNYQ